MTIVIDEPVHGSWGIIGTGWIASMFVGDLILPAKDGVLHSIAAVGSRTRAKAQEFIDQKCPIGGSAQQKGFVQSLPVACGSYEEVYARDDVDIIYIATLHPTHYADARAALEAGKHVLIEKPACLNAAEWKALSALATEKKRFLMEGMWTRFLPIIAKLQHKLFKEKAIGNVVAVNSTFAMAHATVHPDTHRLLAVEAAGGTLMDLGAYGFLPGLLTLCHNPANEKSPPENIRSTMLKGRTGVDLTTTITMEFPKIQATSVSTTSFLYNSPRGARCVISGSKGEIVITDGLSRITEFIVRRVAADNPMSFHPTKWEEDEVVSAPLDGFGLIHEANAVVKSVKAGQLQSDIMPHDETLLVMQIFDTVRQQGGYAFPKGLEQK